ncbi:hypothetical protein A1O3_01772 [Capronia epimyces CBS 606.96]|uniref:Alcohol dehydrogenase n=1 Tax=Capronia epimyces CBS 606.96 TaxID=1182542 RepID=W9YU47_9EURO|nr:uncharacterized protein A1O3_01772 [Capronia epimyces CBS 606.96]EXJ93215.1 hypothetical protein A1O3_01772 [Capronia epimyces CBS 606.96]
MASRIVLVTGANSGVGYAISKVIASASEHFHVIMSGRSLDKVNAAKAELQATGDIKGTLSSLQLDVVDEKSIEQAVAAVDQQHGRLDVLINNAGVTSSNPDIRTRFQTCMETNVLGATLVATTFRPLLLKSKNPYSVYVSSGVGSLHTAAGPDSFATKFPNGEMYRASKAAVNMVMLDEWARFKDQGLKTFGVDPGLVVSNLRGTSEQARSAFGRAEDPIVAGRSVLSIIQGERDGDTGKVVYRESIHPW